MHHHQCSDTLEFQLWPQFQLSRGRDRDNFSYMSIEKHMVNLLLEQSLGDSSNEGSHFETVLTRGQPYVFVEKQTKNYL